MGRREGPRYKEEGKRLTVSGVVHRTMVSMCGGGAMQAVPKMLLEASIPTHVIHELCIDPDTCMTTCHVIKMRWLGFRLEVFFLAPSL